MASRSSRWIARRLPSTRSWMSLSILALRGTTSGRSSLGCTKALSCKGSSGDYCAPGHEVAARRGYTDRCVLPANVQADDFIVIAEIEQAIGKCRRLARWPKDLLAANFLKPGGRGADDHQLARHCAEEQFAVG